MKIAITGKGEVGKTTLSGTLTFISSRTYKVFAIDADPDMNLANSMGIHSKITPHIQDEGLSKGEDRCRAGISVWGSFQDQPEDLRPPGDHVS
jgi:CO dehydrogenase maturation factor